MIYQITLKKVKQKQSNCNTPNRGFKTHPPQSVARHAKRMPIYLNIQKKVRLLLRKLLRSTDDRNQHCGLPCDQAYISAPEKFEVNQLIINICTQLEDI